MILRIFYILCLFFVGFSTITNAQSDVKVGEFNLRATPADVLGSAADQYNSYIKTDAVITWEVYVPENYDATNPPGIMVLAGAPQNVHQPAGWYSVMRDKNLIWVAARKSGNAASIHQRELLALMSVPLIEKHYKTNPERVYITGEGRIASVAAMDNPEIFKGAILSGGLIWSDNAKDKIDGVKDNRFVFVTKERGNVPKGTRIAYNYYKKAGVENVKLIYIPKGHRYGRSKFAKSVDYLDQ